MINTNIHVNGVDLGHVGWKYYNSIKKKAMEQEFSWSGLGISLSIAFFVVIFCAGGLRLTYQSLVNAREMEKNQNIKIYKLENAIFKKQGHENFFVTLANKTFYKSIIEIKSAEAAGETLLCQGEPEKKTEFLKANAGETKNQVIKIKNTGKKTWTKGLVALETGPYLRSFSIFKHDKWLKYYQVAKLDKNVKPGETAVFTLPLQVPQNISATVQQDFHLVEDDRPIKGTLARYFIELSGPANAAAPIIQAAQVPAVNNAAQTPSNFCIASAQNSGASTLDTECQTNSTENDQTNGIINHPQKLTKEPIMRIGLYNTVRAQRITGNDIYDIYAGSRILVSGVPANAVSVISFDFSNKVYTVSTPGITMSTISFVRFVPRSSQGIMTLLDYDNRAKGSGSAGDIMFRNIIEFHYSSTTGKLWAINELPIESYLKGLAETSNYVSVEFQKVIAAAARTYAMYHYNRGVENNIPGGSTKHASEHFHLDATYDQVYRGYASEKRLTGLTTAVDTSRGAVISYNDKIVITPYFSRSDGRTRSWEEVWYGNPKPWLKSVAVPEEAGLVLWGHGVGMSAQGALKMVNKGKGWQEVLKYFYQNTEIKKMYN